MQELDETKINSFADLAGQTNSIQLYKTQSERGKFAQRDCRKKTPVGLSCIRPITFVTSTSHGIFVQNEKEFQRIKITRSANFHQPIVVTDLEQIVGEKFTCAAKVGEYCLSYDKLQGLLCWGETYSTFEFFQPPTSVKWISGSDQDNFFVLCEKTLHQFQSHSYLKMNENQKILEADDKISEIRFMNAQKNEIFHRVYYKEKQVVEEIQQDLSKNIKGMSGAQKAGTTDKKEDEVDTDKKKPKTVRHSSYENEADMKKLKELVSGDNVGQGGQKLKRNVKSCILIIDIEIFDPEEEKRKKEEDKKKAEEDKKKAEEQKKLEEEKKEDVVVNDDEKDKDGGEGKEGEEKDKDEGEGKEGEEKDKDDMKSQKSNLKSIAKSRIGNQLDVEVKTKGRSRKPSMIGDDKSDQGSLKSPLKSGKRSPTRHKKKGESLYKIEEIHDEKKTGRRDIRNKGALKVEVCEPVAKPNIATKPTLPKRRFAIFQGNGYRKGLTKAFINKQDLGKFIEIDTTNPQRAVTATYQNDNGTLFYIGYFNGEVECWSVSQEVSLLKRTEMHSEQINDIKFCGLDTMLTSSMDNSIKISNKTGGNTFQTINNAHSADHEEDELPEIMAVDFLMDQNMVVSSNDQFQVRIHAIEGISEIKDNESSMYLSNLNNLYPMNLRANYGQEKDQQMLVVTSNDSPEMISWTKQEKLIDDIDDVGKNNSWFCSALSHNERFLAIGSEKGDVSIFDFESDKKLVLKYKADKGKVTGLQFNQDNVLLCVGTKDRKIIAWNMNNKNRLNHNDTMEKKHQALHLFTINTTFDDVEPEKMYQHVTKCGEYVAVGGLNHVKIYEIKCPEVEFAHLENIHAANNRWDTVQYIHIQNKQYMITCGFAKSFQKVWDVSKVFAKNTINANEGDLEVVPEKNYFEINNLSLDFDIKTEGFYGAMKVSKDEKLFGYCNQQGSMWIYDISEKDPKDWSMKQDYTALDNWPVSEKIMNFAFNSTDDGDTVFAWTKNSIIKEISLNTPTELLKLAMPHKNPIKKLYYFNNGKYIMTASRAGMKIWKIETKQLHYDWRLEAKGMEGHEIDWIIDIDYSIANSGRRNADLYVVAIYLDEYSNFASNRVFMYGLKDDRKLCKDEPVHFWEINEIIDENYKDSYNEEAYNITCVCSAYEMLATNTHFAVGNEAGDIIVFDGSQSEIDSRNRRKEDPESYKDKPITDIFIMHPVGLMQCKVAMMIYREKYLYAGYEKAFVKIFSSAGYLEVYVFKNLFPDNLYSLDCSSDGQYMVAGGKKELKIYDLKKRELWHNFKELHSDEILDICFTHDNKYIATCSKDRSLSIIDPESKRLVQTFKDCHFDDVTGCTYSPDDQILITVGADRCIKFCDIGSLLLVHEIKNMHQHHKTHILNARSRTLHLSYDDKSQISASHNEIQLVDINQQNVTSMGPTIIHKNIFEEVAENDCITHSAVPVYIKSHKLIKPTKGEDGNNPELQNIATYLAKSNNIKIKNYETGVTVNTLILGFGIKSSKITAMVYNNDGTKLAIAIKSTVYIVDTKNPGSNQTGNKKKKKEKDQQEEKAKLKADEEERKKLAAEDPNYIQNVLCSFAYDSKVITLKFHPFLPSVLSIALYSNDLKIINTNINKEQLLEKKKNDEPVNDDFAEDLEPEEIEAWKKIHTSFIMQIAWSPDGRWLCTGDLSKTAKLFSVKPNILEGKDMKNHNSKSFEKFSLVYTFKDFGGDLEDQAFSWDSKFLAFVTAGLDRGLYTYFVDDQKQLFKIINIDGTAQTPVQVLWTPCRRYILVGTKMSTVKFVNIDNYFNEGRVMLKFGSNDLPAGWFMNYQNPLRNYSFFTYKIWQEFLFKGKKLEISDYIKNNQEQIKEAFETTSIKELDILCIIAAYAYLGLESFLPTLFYYIGQNPDRPDFDNIYNDILEYINTNDSKELAIYHLMPNMFKSVDNLYLGSKELITKGNILYDGDYVDREQEHSEAMREFQYEYYDSKGEIIQVPAFNPIKVVRTTFDIDIANPSHNQRYQFKAIHDSYDKKSFVSKATYSDENFSYMMQQFWNYYKSQFQIYIMFFYLIYLLLFVQGLWVSDSVHVSNIVFVLWNIVILALTFQLIIYELMQALQAGWSYLLDGSNYFDIFAYIFIIVSSVIQQFKGNQDQSTVKISMYCLSLFFGLLKIQNNFIMIDHVATMSQKIPMIQFEPKFLTFMIIIFLFVFAFCSIWYAAAFYNDDTADLSNSYWYYWLWTYNMLFAGWNYASPTKDRLQWMYCLFIIFTLIFPIVLFNWLIAILSDSNEDAKDLAPSQNTLRQLILCSESMQLRTSYNKKTGKYMRVHNERQAVAYKPLIKENLGKDMFEPYIPYETRLRSGKFMYLIRKDEDAINKIVDEDCMDFKLNNVVTSSHNLNSILEDFKDDITEIFDKVAKIDGLELNCSKIAEKMVLVEKKVTAKLKEMTDVKKQLEEERDEYKKKYEELVNDENQNEVENGEIEEPHMNDDYDQEE